MGGTQAKQKSKENSYVSDSSSFFYKQMVTHNQITNIEKFYNLQDKIGQGTYATVYKSRSVLSGCICSVKKVEKTKVPGIEQTLRNQFDILRGLDHPNIMKLYGLYEDSKYFYVVAQLIKGRELFEQFKQRKAFQEKEAFQIFQQVVLCLNYLHRNNIMHRDIKLQNIIYDAKSKILKLIDFGTACQFETKEPSPYKCVGTASYIAPEVIKKKYNYMCDNWSLGVFLHILLTGSPPFPGKTQEDIFKAIQNNPPNFTSDIYNKLPDARLLVSRLLEKQPEKRLKIQQIFVNPWFRKNLSKKIISNEDHQCILQIFKNLRKFSTLKIAQIQLGVLVLMNNFIVNLENQESIIRCFHCIDVEGDGVITQTGLKTALVEFQDLPENKAKAEAAIIMSKIDFNHNKDIDYSQFLVASSDLRKVLTEENLQKAFKLIDVDSSGRLSVKELRKTLGDNISEIYYKQIIKYFDTDHDQQISLQQFKMMMKKLIK